MYILNFSLRIISLNYVSHCIPLKNGNFAIAKLKNITEQY